MATVGNMQGGDTRVAVFQAHQRDDICKEEYRTIAGCSCGGWGATEEEHPDL